MAVKELSDDIVSVVLSAEPRTRRELADITERCSKKCNFDIIIDFHFVEVLASTSISDLIALRGWVEGAGRKLVLYNVRVITRCIFDVAGTNYLFEFAKDENDALRVIKESRRSQQYSADADKNQNALTKNSFVRSSLRRIFGHRILKR
jgi:anti-anti-sigma regulatory factor